MATAEKTTAGAADDDDDRDKETGNNLVPADPTPEQAALAVLEQSHFLAVRPSSDISEALRHNMATGDTINEQDLTRVPTPSGGKTTKWTFTDVSGEETIEEIVGALVFYGPRGVLWPSEDPSNAQPVLITHDLQIATRISDDLGTIDPEILEAAHIEGRIYDWTKLKYNEFGTSKNGHGKRCKESRILCILRPGDAYPLLINAGAGSLKMISPFVKKLPVPHFRAVVGLKLQIARNKGGQDYCQIVPRLVGQLSREEGAILQQLYTKPLVDVIKKIAPRQDSEQTGDE